jgi:hypothetical protein
MSFEAVANLPVVQNSQGVRRITQLTEYMLIIPFLTRNECNDTSVPQIHQPDVSHLALSTRVAKPFWRGSGWKY